MSVPTLPMTPSAQLRVLSSSHFMNEQVNGSTLAVTLSPSTGSAEHCCYQPGHQLPKQGNPPLECRVLALGVACMELANLSARTLERTLKLIQENACGVRAQLPLSSHFHSE